MKLQDLPMGARFEYEGVVYFKTGPLTASSEAGGQRIIPRYAVLRSLEAPPRKARAGWKGRQRARLSTTFLRLASGWSAKPIMLNWNRRVSAF